MEPKESEKLTNELSEAVTAVSSLQGEVHTLQTHIHHVSIGCHGNRGTVAYTVRDVPQRIPTNTRGDCR